MVLWLVDINLPPTAEDQTIAALLAWPVSHGEGLQVLRYRPGAEYQPHYDYFDPKEPGTKISIKEKNSP